MSPEDDNGRAYNEDMTGAEEIVRALVAWGREDADEVEEAGVWDDGYCCIFCGRLRWWDGHERPGRPHLTTEGHSESCLWRRSVRWVDGLDS